LCNAARPTGGAAAARGRRAHSSPQARKVNFETEAALIQSGPTSMVRPRDRTCASRAVMTAPQAAMGRSQVVRQRILIPPFPGSSPGAPANDFRDLGDRDFAADCGWVSPGYHGSEYAPSCALIDARKLCRTGDEGVCYIPIPSPLARPSCHEMSLPRMTPKTSRPISRSMTGRHGTRLKWSPSSIMAKRPLAS
jgi:hypothetical protein